MPHQIAARQAILDGEIAVLDEKGVSRFHLIQPRIANSDPNSIAHLVRSTPGGLLRLRPALSRWLRSARRALGAAPRTAGGRGHARRRAAHLGGFPGAGEPCWRPRARIGLEGSGGQARLEPLRIAPQPRVAQDQDRQRAGVRHRRIHRAAGRSRPFRRAGARRLRRTANCSGWAMSARASTRRLLAALYAPSEAADHREVPVRRASQARPGNDLGASRNWSAR